MIKECFDTLAGLIKEFQQKVISQIKSINNDSAHFQAMTDIQQSIISIGNELEKAFRLEESELIRNFQKCCELCWQCAASAGNREYFDELLLEVSKWPSALENSIPVQDRRLSLVVIVHNEEPYIEEWLAYHFLLGVSHVYLYDNGSTDGTKEKLRGYIDRGQVTYIWWPGDNMQRPAYDNAVAAYRYDTVYMGFLDTDEFLLPARDTDLLQEIDRTFERCEKRMKEMALGDLHCGGICINWRLYGTSGHKTKPSGLVIENYKYRAEDISDNKDFNAPVKTICNPRTVKKCWVHTMEYIDGYCSTSENGSYLPGGTVVFYDSRCNRLRINHYRTKSEEEFMQRRRKGYTNGSRVIQSDEQIQELLNKYQACNAIYDPIMERYIPQVKKRLADKEIQAGFPPAAAMGQEMSDMPERRGSGSQAKETRRCRRAKIYG